MYIEDDNVGGQEIVLHNILGHFVASCLHDYFMEPLLSCPTHDTVPEHFKRFWGALLAPASACQAFHKVIVAILRVIFALPAYSDPEFSLRDTLQRKLWIVTDFGFRVHEPIWRFSRTPRAWPPTMRAYAHYLIQRRRTSWILEGCVIGEGFRACWVQTANAALEALQDAPDCVLDILSQAVVEDLDAGDIPLLDRYDLRVMDIAQQV
jgi:hypothetical protein